MKIYRSRAGRELTKEQWAIWADAFYRDSLGIDFEKMPEDWFDRISIVLALEEVIE